MPNVNGSFQGATLILPGVYYKDNVSAALPVGAATTPPLIFIGFGYGGKPQTPLYHATQQGISAQLRGAPATEFVKFFMTPSGEVAGAQQITYINPAPNTQSTLSLLDGAATPVAVINLTSADYGTPSNLLQAQVQAGTIGGIELTLYDGYANVTAVGNNLGLPFQIAYTGSATTVTYSVTATDFTLTSPTAGESVTFPLGTGAYETIATLVEGINGTGHYVAQTISDTNGNLPSTSLDIVSDVALPAPTSGVYDYVNVTAVLGDPVFWVNTYAAALASAAIASGVTSGSSTAPAVIPMTFFTGATNVVPTLQDYANALNLALTLPGWAVIMDTNQSGISALGTQHVLTASSITNHRYRRYFTGSSVGDSISVTQANARSMNAKEASYCYPGIWRTSLSTGVNTLYGGLYWAACCAGIACGNRVAVPMTNKSLIGNGVEVALTTPDINQLQGAGVMCLRVPDSTGVPTIVRDLTTWQNDNNPENVNNQQVACRQALAYSMIATLSPYVGQINAGTISLGRVKNTVKSLLNAMLYSAPGSSGILAAWDAKSLSLTYNGGTQTLGVTVSVQFVGQNVFITVFVPVQPLMAAA